MGKSDQPRGPDGRWIPRGSIAAGIALIVGFVAIGGTAGPAASSGSGATAGRPGSSKQIKAKDRDVTRLVRRLQTQGLRVEPVSTSSDANCVANSYGQVRGWFTDNRCSSLHRVLLRVTDRNRAVAMVAVAVVDMPDSDGASELKSLVDDFGTGNVTELRGRPSVDWTGRYYASTRDDATVVNAQAEPVGRAAGAERLAGLAAQSVIHD